MKGNRGLGKGLSALFSETEEDYGKSLIFEEDQGGKEGVTEIEIASIFLEKYSEVNCVYYLKGDEGTTKVSEEYVLRKDDEGKWKILYWKLADKEDGE